MSGDLATQPPVATTRRDPTTRNALRRWLVGGVAGVGFLLVALVVATYFGATFGVQTALLAMVVALLPLGVVIPTFLWLDRFESEPTRYLVGAFLWGALVAAAVAAVFNTSAIAVLEVTTDPELALATTAVLVAPVVEEALKGVLVLFVWWFRRHEFDGITDGMVYAGVCAAGFAFTENMQYLAVAWSQGGGEALTATFVARCLMSPFAHPMFTVLTGIGVGVAATSRTWLPRILAPVIGFGLAVLAHALWNLAAVSGGRGMITVYLLVEVPIFLAFVAFVGWTRRREGHLIGQFLRPYADAGWLSPAEV
ncbi:MAG TPA: PrsW family intramembrane metalloprotease, partial [Ornithinibacter sp.]|nr:PrsW family intramembrane metalloprotease [Ornithinibacter sp.]